ncbi:MAG: acylneuraminate cytidylyltransferase [Clostridiales bacterium]|nr:acylneuraminate cytidylyltransferase [Clostridiales bacterium]
MKLTGIMPIKLNNERLPGKNVKLLNGKPLLCYELENLLGLGIMDSIYVYCSDSSICDYLPKGIEYLQRPKYLDLPTSNFTQIFDEFIRSIDSDVYLYAHATAPFISQNTMRQCIDAVVSREYDSAFCALKIQDFLWKNGDPLNFDAINVPRSQDLDPIYRETSGIYVFTKEMYKREHRRIGKKPFIKEVNYKEAIDINNPEDFSLAEALVDVNI